MDKCYIGIECTLDEGRIEYLLQFLSRQPCDFFIPWCSRISSTRQRLPQAVRNFYSTPRQLVDLGAACIWELVLQLWPEGADAEPIEAYADYVSSDCLCCVIYYDCAELEVFAKDPAFLEQVRAFLTENGARDLCMIGENDVRRDIMHL